jgi:protein FAM32A
MPSEEYSSFGKGALKLKGGGSKVKKHKKKKKDTGSDLEKALSTGEPSSRENGQDAGNAVEKKRSKRTDSASPGAEDRQSDGEAPAVRQKTEAELRFEEAKKKKVSIYALYSEKYSVADFCYLALGDVQVCCWTARTVEDS